MSVVVSWSGVPAWEGGRSPCSIALEMCGSGAKDGEVVGVFGLECGVWLACGSVFGLGVVNGEAGVLELVVDYGGGLWDEAGWDGDVEVVEVGLGERGSVWVSWEDKLLEVVVDLEESGVEGEGENGSGEGAALGGAGICGVLVDGVEVVGPKGVGRSGVPGVSDGAE